MESNTLNFPLFLKVSKTEFENLLKQSNEILGFPNGHAQEYCRPILDKYQNIYFIVNPEVSEIVDLNKCVEFSQIEFESF